MKTAASHGIEQPATLVALGKRRRALEIGQLHQQFGQQPRELGQPCPVQLHQPRPQRVGSQPRHHRAVGDLTFRRVAPRLRRGCALAGTPHVEFVDEPGLAHPGLPAHQHELGPTRVGGAPHRGELRPLERSADERAGPVLAGVMGRRSGSAGTIAR